MLIYYNGDSNTNGAELERGQCFTDIVADHYGAKYYNQALNGGSCDHIIRTTRDYISHCKKTNIWPDLMIIGWTECFRSEWFVNGNHKTVISLEAYNEVVDPVRYEYVKNNMWGNTNYIRAIATYMNEVIYNLHCELDHLKIPHLFFNAIDSLNLKNKIPHWEKIHQYDFKQNFLHPYEQDQTMREWAFTRKYKEVTPGWHHFEYQAQQDWAKILIDHIDQNKLLTT